MTSDDEVSDLRDVIHQLNDRIEGLVYALSERDKTILIYRVALQEIHDTCGRVCAEYEICTHESCKSSYSAWAIASSALGL